MNKRTFTIHFILLLLIHMLPFTKTGAQVTETELRSEKYSAAILNIIATSDKFNNTGDVIEQINSTQFNPIPWITKPGILNTNFFFLNPAIDLVSFSGNEPALFTYFASNNLAADTTLAIDLSNVPDWVLAGSLSVDTVSNTITISVSPNLTGLARSASFETSTVISGETLSFTANILQEPAPQQFIFVSPQFMALPPEAGVAGPFAVTHFNISNWEAVITDSWVTVDSSSLSSTSVSFNVAANNTSLPRTAGVEVRAAGNPAINDVITLLQYPSPQPYIITSPVNIYASSLGGVVSSQVFANIDYSTAIVLNPGNMITQAVASVNSDSIYITVAANPGSEARMAKIALSGGNPVVSDTLRVYQSASYILLIPSEKVVPCTAISFSADIINYNAGSLTIASQPSWVTTSISGGSLLNVNVTENLTGLARTGTILVQSNGNPGITGMLEVAQYACSQPYIIVSPAAQAAAWDETQLSSPFTVISNSVTTLGIIVSDTWLTAELSGDLISVTLEPNLQNTIRTAQIVVLDIAQTEVIDIVEVIQGGTLAYLLVSPQFQSVSYSGGPSNPYTVTTLGVENWEVWFDEMPTWISEIHQSGNQVIFDLALNDAPQSRQAVFQVRDTSDPTRFDEAIIFQKAAPQPFIFLAPRQKVVAHAGQPFVNFTVTQVNVITWEVDNATLPPWIEVNPGGQDVLSLSVDENISQMTRSAVVRIHDTSNPAVSDSVQIYQYSALDTFLLASPREQLVSHNGENGLIFTVMPVNVPSWSIDASSLPAWITGIAEPTQLTLEIEPNITLETRQALIRIAADNNPSVKDSVYVFQYSALDTFLIAAPREQLVNRTGQEIVFQVTSANLSSWQFDSSTVPGWITITESGNELFGMQVSANTTLQTRQATIRIFSGQHPNIEDYITVYQYAGPDEFLIAAPRERRVVHFGEEMVEFSVIRVNVPAWEFTNTSPYEDWIGFSNIGDSIIRLNVTANTTLLSRQAEVIIQAVGNSTVRDTVSVYQYSALDEYLLASPREHQVQYNDTIVHFAVTTVNLTENWLAEFIDGDEWITVLNSGSDLLSLQIAANPVYVTRTGSIRLYLQNDPGVADTVSVYQFASPTPSLLASPREQNVAHTGNTNLSFEVTRVNVEMWQADAGTNDWISIVISGSDVLTLNISENLQPETRIGIVHIADITDPAVKDSVIVYQYSALNSYLLASPREKVVTYSGASEEFHIVSVNVNNWVVDTYPDWITPGNPATDTLRIIISMNTTLSSRIATLFISDQNNPLVYDSVSVYQFASPDPHIIIAPREKKIAHTGSYPVDFDVTLVNVNSWEFADTITHTEWIDYFNIGDSILRLRIEENDALHGRSAVIAIQATDNPGVRDSISIYQYSSLDHYILIEPREQLVRSYSADTLAFRILSVNVDNMDFEVISDPSQMIDAGNSMLTGDTLKLFINSNQSNSSRQAGIRVFDTEKPGIVSDTVSVYQNFPYIILRPAALDSIPWTDSIVKIHTYSNIGTYQVAGKQTSWYRIGKDQGNWSNDPLILRGNDSIYMQVDTNANAFLRRSSYLTFSFNEDVANQFWFDQDTRPGTFFSVAGSVFIYGDPNQPLPGVRIALYDSIKITGAEGTFRHGTVPENWIGTITPLIDTALAVPYYFIPSRIEVNEPGILDNTEIDPFAAYKILPTVMIAPDTIFICAGDILSPGSLNYPAITTSNTYGSINYAWTSSPVDQVMEQSNPNRINPEFGPEVTTTYKLVINNFYRTDSAYFTIAVRQLPDMVEFAGQLSVCANQAGTVYQVTDPLPGVYYKWILETDNPGGIFANSANPYAVSGNIAIVNWGNNSGNYLLHLFAYNQYDCVGEPITAQIQVSEVQALAPTAVLRKGNDNMLYCSDSLATYYQWGWFTKNSSGELAAEYIIPDKNSWYCRLPEGHVFNPSVYYYFVIAYHAGSQCGSRSFFNAPVGIPDAEVSSFTVFPNPNRGIFTIRNSVRSNKPVWVEVINALGQVVYNQEFENSFEAATVHLQSSTTTVAGIYLIRIMSNEKVTSIKFIVE